ncbi:MAG: hypothetical protein DMD79_23475 [Candidatus Rokuibacteriota bacterium]|nr:MAG: hypothetical protein DMD79_23475 [Candidatus Rokubacteria bacterium]
MLGEGRQAYPAARQPDMAERSLDWFRQAEAHLRHARNARDDGDHNWSAIEAVFQRRYLDAWGTRSVASRELAGGHASLG